MFQVFIAKYCGQFNLLNFERNRKTVMSPSTDRVRTNIVTPPPGGMRLNSQRHSDSTSRAPVVGQHITPVSGQVGRVNRLRPTLLYLGESGIFAVVSSSSIKPTKSTHPQNLHIVTW